MRASEFAKEMPATYVLPKLSNQDPYMQYRFGLALASARAKKEGLIPFEEESPFGESLIVVCRSKEEQETLELAVALFGKDAGTPELISTEKSEEEPDVNVKSTLGSSKKK